MQLTPSRPAGDATELATALRDAAAQLGHRPAISYLASAGRQEQSFASLAQWAAKGAHWLALDQLLEPGARVGIAGPPGWVPAAVALAAWWAGCAVAVGDAVRSAHVVVAQTAHVPVTDADVLVWGGGFDGAPTESSAFEAWTHAVQAFPDQPPPPAASADAAALDDGATSWTQRELLELHRGSPRFTAGVETGTPVDRWLPAIAVRPLLTGRPTVVLGAGVDRGAAARDGVTEWIAP